MQLEIKFKSIAVRWFFNIFLIVAVVVCTVIIALSAVVSSLYTERITTLADDITYEFNSLSAATRSNFKDAAVELAENFPHKTKLEVQVIDRNDNIVVTTTGFRLTEQIMKRQKTAAARRLLRPKRQRARACFAELPQFMTRRADI